MADVKVTVRQPYIEYSARQQVRQPYIEYSARQQVRQPYTEYAGVTVRQPFAELILKTVRQPYNELSDKKITVRQPWDELTVTPVRVTVRQPYNEWDGVTVRQPYNELSDKRVTVRQPWSELTVTPVRVTVRQPYNEWNGRTVRQPYGYAAETTVHVTVRQPWSELTVTPVQVTVRQPWLELSPSFQNQSGTVQVKLGNKVIKTIEGPTVRQDEGSLYWQCSFKPAYSSDFGLLLKNAAFTVEFYGTTYSFIVDTRQLSRANSLATNAPTDTASISGLSPLANLASPRAQTLEKTYPNDTTAKAIVEDLIGTVDWQILNWPIQANAFGVSGQSPLAAAQQIVQAAKALIQAKPDGSALVRSLYPNRVPDYPTTTPDLTLTAATISQISESANAQQYYNRFVIRDNDSESASQDRLEFIEHETDARRGTVHAYPDPFRTNLRLTSTRNGISIAELGQVNRQETEEFIEIVDGRASVQHPITSIINVTYHDTHLGGVTFSGSELTTTIAGWSLMTITYTTRSINYDVRATADIKAQFLLEQL